MSLRWNLEGIENYKQVCWNEDEEMNPVTNVLIWSTISVGLGSITDKNVNEFAARFRITEKLDGPFLNKGGKGTYLSDEDFIAHIGLVCNVRNETRAQWASRLFVKKQTSSTEQRARSFRQARKVTA